MKNAFKQPSSLVECRSYQTNLKARLDRVFPPDTVAVEWRAMTDEAGIYSPRLDVAVGPFATHQRFEEHYNHLANVHRPLITRFYHQHNKNIARTLNEVVRFDFDRTTHQNSNARCFLAIEVENQVSHKHLMGGAINAAALGRIGLAVAFNSNALTRFVRMREYLLFLSNVGKNSFNTSNLLILTAEQLLEIINKHIAESLITQHTSY